MLLQTQLYIGQSPYALYCFYFIKFKSKSMKNYIHITFSVIYVQHEKRWLKATNELQMRSVNVMWIHEKQRLLQKIFTFLLVLWQFFPVFLHCGILDNNRYQFFNVCSIFWWRDLIQVLSDVVFKKYIVLESNCDSTFIIM